MSREEVPWPGIPILAAGDTALLLTIEAIELSGSDGIDRKLKLKCFWSAELRRAQDGKCVYFTSSHVVAPKEYRLLDWSEENAEKFRGVLRTLSQEMADQIGEWLR